MKVEEVTEVTDELVEALARLMVQLSRSAALPTPQELQQMVDSDVIRLLVARNEQAIMGTLTLALFRIPTGVRAWIEDVVVDEAARGQGIGEALNRRALDLAKECGARTVDLTSRPSREAANRLYQRMGFKPRETNVYRYSLE
ncbi:MAG: GNAT family N-acetyltransferase [Acidobacteriota bacterium]|nr:GNAT family N-acetyltransferase [Acidobacteriota bacterium]